MHLHPVFWKALCAVLLLCLLAQQFGLPSTNSIRAHVFDASHSSHSSNPTTPTEHYPQSEIANTTSGWAYEWERDHNDRGLSDAQCDVAFPDLYYEIDRAVMHWRSHTITPSMLDIHSVNDAAVRVLLVDQQVRVLQTRGMKRVDLRARVMSVLHQLQRAITAAANVDKPMPDMEFTMIVDDRVAFPHEAQPFWTFARKPAVPEHESVWVMPDFHFWGAPPEAEAFRMQQAKCRQHDNDLAQKIPKLIWRGAEWTNPAVRRPLLDATAGKPWADVAKVDWEKPEEIMPLDAFCKYRYTVNTEGRSWSARLTHLLNCDSLLFVHDVEWVAHYYHLLNHGSNCVRAERDFSDLEEKVLYYNNHLDEAQAIVNTQKEMFRERYLSPAATACYWRKLMRSWAAVSFKPATKVMPMQTSNIHSGEKPRGISFAEFVVHDNTQDFGDDEKLDMLHENTQAWVPHGQEHIDFNP